MTKPRKPKRRLKDEDVYYRCPACEWVGYCVTDRYYISCGQCNRRFGLVGRTVTKEVYDRRFKNT